MDEGKLSFINFKSIALEYRAEITPFQNFMFQKLVGVIY